MPGAWGEELRWRLIGGAGSALVAGLFRTCRLESVDEERYLAFWRSGRPVVFAIWHGRLLAGAFAQRANGLVALISQHRDGEYIARVVERWGYTTVRGSSTRGGTSALRGLLHHLRTGRSVVVTPDGPRGPRQRMKPGALVLAQLSGAPIVPVATSADRGWWIEGWDRFLVPKPFSRVRVVYGEPMEVPRQADEEALARAAGELEVRLNELTGRADVA